MTITVAELVELLDHFLPIRKDLSQMAATLADLTAKVTAQKTVIDSAVTLLNGLSQALKEALASNDPSQVQAIIDALDAQDTSLAAAVQANTPAPAPPAGPPA